MPPLGHATPREVLERAQRVRRITRTILWTLVGIFVAYQGYRAIERKLHIPDEPEVQGITPALEASLHPGRPVIFLGLDGADWSLLDEYRRRGAMPNLDLLVREGRAGNLRTIDPPLSPLVWTSMFSGSSPLEHGILDFTRFNPVTGQREPITSTERRVPALWNMATAAGKSVAVFGPWATWPAEAVRGLVVSDRFISLPAGADPPARAVYPESELPWVLERRAEVERKLDFEALAHYLPDLTSVEHQQALVALEPYAHPISGLRRLLVETRLVHALATDWLSRQPVDLAVIYIQGTDLIGHLFAAFAPPKQPSVSPSDFNRFQGVPAFYFREIDGMFGAYRRLAAQRHAVLVVASDHGFYWGEGRPQELSSQEAATAAKWHRRDGVFVVWGEGVGPEPIFAPADAPVPEEVSASASAPAAAPEDATGTPSASPDVLTDEPAYVEVGPPKPSTVLEIAPTLLALLGLPPGAGMSSDVLPGVSRSGATALFDYGPIYHPVAEVSLAEQERGHEALARLRALGYLGSSETTSAPAGARGGSHDTRTPASFNNEGLLLRARGETRAAAAAFERALVLDAGYTSAAWNLSDLLFAEGRDRDRADQLLLRAHAGGLAEGDRHLVGRVLAWRREGETARGQALLDAGLATAPSSAPLRLLRGRYRLEAGDCPAALTDLAEAAALAPRDPLTHASLGLARACVGDARGARAALERSLQLDPDQPQVRAFLASM